MIIWLDISNRDLEAWRLCSSFSGWAELFLRDLFLAFFFKPKIEGKTNGHKGKNDAKFIDIIGGIAGVSGQGCEDFLNEEVVTRVQDDGRPQAPGLHAKPGVNKADGDNEDHKARHGIPGLRPW